MLPSNLKVMGVFCASWAEETCVFWLVLGLSPHPITSWDQHPACDSREHSELSGDLATHRSAEVRRTCFGNQPSSRGDHDLQAISGDGDTSVMHHGKNSGFCRRFF